MKYSWWLVLAVALATLAAVLIVKYAEAQEPLKASWYSMESLKQEGTFKTSKGVMANGRLFNENDLTCACRLYPLGTVLRVTNTLNGKSVVVKVTDRIGKRFATTRIDLSKAAFAAIASLKSGVVPIRAEVVR